MLDLNLVEKQMSEILDEYRLAHTLSVKDECLRLAALFQLNQDDTETLAMAALLHDCTKPHKKSAQLDLAARLGIELTSDDTDNPSVLHSITGAVVAKLQYGASEIVSNAIACHTTGKENMTIIDKLLFLADYIEPLRTFEDCIQVRRYFYEDSIHLPLVERLDSTLLLAFDLTISQLLADHYSIHPLTIKSRNFLLKKS